MYYRLFLNKIATFESQVRGIRRKPSGSRCGSSTVASLPLSIVSMKEAVCHSASGFTSLIMNLSPPWRKSKIQGCRIPNLRVRMGCAAISISSLRRSKCREEFAATWRYCRVYISHSWSSKEKLKGGARWELAIRHVVEELPWIIITGGCESPWVWKTKLVRTSIPSSSQRPTQPVSSTCMCLGRKSERASLRSTTCRSSHPNRLKRRIHSVKLVLFFTISWTGVAAKDSTVWIHSTRKSSYTPRINTDRRSHRNQALPRRRLTEGRRRTREERRRQGSTRSRRRRIPDRVTPCTIDDKALQESSGALD